LLGGYYSTTGLLGLVFYVYVVAEGWLAPGWRLAWTTHGRRTLDLKG
jgi:hypothetical protein